MISDKDLNRIRELQEDNPELDYLFEELKNDYKTTISCISHELRNSLTLIIGALQLIEASHPETRDFNHWSEIGSDLADMKSFLINVSDYNSCEKLSLTKIDLSLLLKEVHKSCLSLRGNTNKKLTCLCPEEPVLVWGDRKKLKHALVNLVKNAFEAVKNDAQILLALEAAGDTATIIVQDDGIGITDQQLPEIFKPFMTYKKQGTGLGLPIAKKIIEAHHGTLQLQSTSDQGTAFTISLHRMEPPAF